MTEGRQFKPYKGGLYHEGLMNGRKVLIVGESHYEADGSDDFTTTTVNQCAIEKPSNFFKKIRATACGLTPPPPPAEFWHRVAFANVVQESMADASDRPTHAQMTRGMTVLKATIRELQPDLILCYSVLAWDDHIEDRLSDEPGYGRGRGVQPGFDAMWWFPRPGAPDILGARINHPSRFNVNIQVWRVWVDKAWQLLRDGTPVTAPRDAA